MEAAETRKSTLPRSADEWKRKFITESKVNKELGRRLSEMKDKIDKQRSSSDRIRLPVDLSKLPQNQGGDATTATATATCAHCETLQAEVARLRKLLVEHHIDADEQNDRTTEMPQLLARPSLVLANAGDSLRRSHGILVRQPSGKIQCLRDMLDEETPRKDVIECVRRLSNVMVAPIAMMAPLAEEPTSVAIAKPLTSTIPVPSPASSTPATGPMAALVAVTAPAAATARRVLTTTTTKTTTTASTASTAALLHGIEDKSLGDLFKYAIVLAGPMQRPKKSALSSFLKAADFRRPKSQSLDSLGGGGIDAINPARKGSVSTTATLDAAKRKASDRPLPVSTTSTSTGSIPAPVLCSPQSVQDVTSKSKLMEVTLPPGSPMKKGPTWLSNIVPPRFRAASTEVAAPPPLATPPPVVKPQDPIKQELVKQQPPPPILPGSSSAKTPLFSLPTAKPDPMKPRMLAVFPPPTGKGGVAELEGLQEICFPYSDKLPPLSDFSVANLKRTLQERHRTYRSPDSTFVLTIATGPKATEITYAICVHLPLFPDDDTVSGSGGSEMNVDADGDKLPSHGCISLLSAYPFFSLFFKVVFGIASIWESRRKEYVQDYAIALKERKTPPSALTMKDFVDHFQGVMLRMKEMKVPVMGGWTRLVLAPQYTPLAFHRPHSKSVTAERRMLVLEYAAPMLFALLSVDQVLFLLGCLCCERKVLVVSDHANIVSSCVLALITLLEPLQWAGPVITLLPPRLDELLEAPVPLIAGRVSINSGAILNFSTLTKPMNGVIEMNMDQNNLCMHEEDLMKYHEMKLPGCDALVHELHHFSSQLFERHLSADFPSLEQMQACDIICSRIHTHMQSICCLATGEVASLDVASPLFCATPRRQTMPASLTSPSSTTSTVDSSVWTRRCSDAVQDYIERFQETQMFSMFKLQRQDEKDEEDAQGDDDDDDDEDEEDGDEEEEEDQDGIGKNGGSRTNSRKANAHRVAQVTSSDEEEGEEEDTTECAETDAVFTDQAVTYRTMA